MGDITIPVTFRSEEVTAIHPFFENDAFAGYNIFGYQGRNVSEIDPFSNAFRERRIYANILQTTRGENPEICLQSIEGGFKAAESETVRVKDEDGNIHLLLQSNIEKIRVGIDVCGSPLSRGLKTTIEYKPYSCFDSPNSIEEITQQIAERHIKHIQILNPRTATNG